MMLYLLKFTLCSATLLLFYKVVLEREKLLRFNRFYLLGSLVLSLVIPLVSFELPSGQATVLTASNYVPFEAGKSLIGNSVGFTPGTTTADRMDWPKLAWIVYLLIASYLLLRFFRNLFGLLIRVRQNEALDGGNSWLVLLDEPTVPHSFLQSVFLNKTDYLNDEIAAEIIHHERAHVRQRHTLDLLLVEFVRAVCWANPVLYLYRQAIVLNHEFLADAEVLTAAHNTEDYQYLLLRHSMRPTKLSLASQFNYSFLKKRFVMMHKQTSPVRAALAQVSVLPLLAIAFFAFSDLSLAQTTRQPIPVEKDASSTSVKKPLPSPPAVDYVYEYNSIVSKYLRKTTSNSVIVEIPSPADANRLEVLRSKMNKQQSESVKYLIFTLPPSAKSTPTVAEYEKFKDPKIYGIWINEKKVTNSALDKYEASDFSDFFVSKLYLNAQKTIGYKYKYQVNMMTNEYYDKYLRDRIKNPHRYLRPNPDYSE